MLVGESMWSVVWFIGRMASIWFTFILVSGSQLLTGLVWWLIVWFSMASEW